MGRDRRVSSRLANYERQLYIEGNAALKEERPVRRTERTAEHAARSDARTTSRAAAGYAQTRSGAGYAQTRSGAGRSMTHARSAQPARASVRAQRMQERSAQRLQRPIYTQAVPDRSWEIEERPGGQVSERVRKNRRRALQTSRKYVMFLALASVMTVFSCIYYLQLKSSVTGQLTKVASLESELTELQSENDALQAEAEASVDLDDIRRQAQERLGMKYAEEGQIVWYKPSTGSYVRQYQDVPDAN